ncbi:hypothetical protein K469DRAFT_699711 [Zopfia rhizophila CBS 207.26]|uniref:Uncharacterized protein n=1 Tax=Zopfia rhizophila CBS 207.26 TaxID=1314779 RepID=A0A6A6EGA7_9PEZI|nr:hypothetical protein K469DRAFT_699711 [Zopfia rhizophila CBS 207.26]
MRLSALLRGNEHEIYICYTRKHLRRGGPVDLALQEIQLGDIITAGTTTENGRIFHQAVLSFAIIFFGTQHGQAYITNQGYAMHGVALKQLNHVLSDPICYTCDEVILSVVTLAMLECLVPTGPKYYLRHMIGLERLLELRDPSSYCSPKSSELYKSVRHMILFASLRTGKPSILARAEWKTVLRANCSDEELQEQDLYDVLADCTVLVAERDNMLANWELDLERGTHQRDKIKRRALPLLTHLRAWRKRWDSDGRNSYFETSAAFARLQPMQESRGDDSPHFPTIFEFSNDSAATMLMFYNTTLIYVLQVLASLPLENFGIHSNQSFIQNTLQDAGYLDDLWKHTKYEYIAAERLAALEVCRCIPYYLVRKSRLDSDSSPVVHWAVTTAWMTLRGNESAEGRWMMDLLNRKSREVIAKGLWAI